MDIKLIHRPRSQGKSVAAFIWQRLKCEAGWHLYHTHQLFGQYSRRIICPYCRGDWALLDAPRLMTPWGSDFHKMYESFGFKIEPLPWSEEALAEAEIEAEAQRIYESWPKSREYPWVPRGNSDMQYVARKQARKALAARKGEA